MFILLEFFFIIPQTLSLSFALALFRSFLACLLVQSSLLCVNSFPPKSCTLRVGSPAALTSLHLCLLMLCPRAP